MNAECGLRIGGVVARTSDDYKPCVALWPTGERRKANVYYIRLMDVETATDALRNGRIAFVAPGDEEKVQERIYPKG